MLGIEFEKKLKEIFFHIARYGAAKEFSLNNKPEDFNYSRFYSLRNEGFKIGQQLALEELKKLEVNRQKTEDSLKEFRVKKIKEAIKNCLFKLKINKYKTNLIRSLMYTIAWQLFDGQKEILARFYTDEKSNNQLYGNGFEAILNTAKEINQDTNRFALISDLTNNIQIGDLLVINPDSYEVIEVKTGKKNEEARRLLDFYKLNEVEVTKENVSKRFEKKFAKQLLRMQKQDVKLDRLKKIIELDSGDHPKYEETKVNIFENPIPDETFHKEIADLLNQLKEKDWAFTNIGGVVNVGVYKNDWRLRGRETLTKINRGYPVYNALALGVNLSEPIFAKPVYWSDQNIIKIALKKIKIYIGIDFDQFIKFANDFGLPMRWSTRKELNRLFDSMGMNKKEIFSYNNKGLVIEDFETKGKPMFVGQGMLFNIIYGQISPHTLVMNRAITFEEYKINLMK